MTYERLYVVQWSSSGKEWGVVKDERDGRKVPAAYDSLSEAESRRAQMAEAFPDHRYRVVGFEHVVSRPGVPA